MKKTIPQKVANKVYEKLLPENQNRRYNDWVEKVLYKSGTNQISNRFFKNKVSQFTYKCRCSWCISGKQASTRRKINKLESDLNDYLQS